MYSSYIDGRRRDKVQVGPWAEDVNILDIEHANNKTQDELTMEVDDGWTDGNV